MTGEFYTPIPKGYKSGRTKYVIVTGSVMSGLGKGTLTSSLCKIFADRGLNVEPMKLEAYLNVDAGTLNPFRHGEVFVLDDGYETDMDLGSYERFVDKDLSRDNFVTSGRIYQQIIEKERSGGYLGRDVQFIPHVTGEIKKVVRDLAVKKKPDVIIIEIGGTVGDYENMFALEALRELMFEEGEGNSCFVNVTYIIEPPSLGEYKSKAAQLGIRRLASMGIKPDMIICRSHSPIPKSIREKISINSSVPMDFVLGVEDIDKIYELPLELRKRDVDGKILDVIELKGRFRTNGNKKLVVWTKKNRASKKAKKLEIGLAGKYTNVHDAYISILKALEHCEGPLNVKVGIEWVETTEIERNPAKLKELKKLDGVIIPGGFGKRGIEGKIAVAGYCRKNNIPYLGLCLGAQVAIISFARDVCGLRKANSGEFAPGCSQPVIDLLPEQYKIESMGGNMRLGGQDVEIIRGTNAYRMHAGKKRIRRRFRHRWEISPEYIEVLEEKGMVFSGKHPKQPIMQIIELPKHKFYMGTQYHPEFTSRPLKPDPLFLNFVKAAKGK